MPRNKKFIIYAFWNKSKKFKRWKTLLEGQYKIKTFNRVEKFFDSLLFHPPDLVFYYYEKDPKNFQVFVRDIKLHFNLVRLPLILIVHTIDTKLLEPYLSAIDDVLPVETCEEEIIIRTKLSIARLDRISDNNPLTGLPGNVSIEKKIKEALEADKPVAVIYVDLDNFKAYNDLYGFSKGDEMIKNLAKILVNTIKDLCKDGFVGHIGGDDFVAIAPLEKAEEVAKTVIARFDTIMPKLVSQKDWQRGYFISKDRQGNLCTFPLPSVSLAIVPVYKGKFKHIGEIAERAGQIKKIVKSIQGSAYFIDRRA
ncbi:MAG: GGDEF domain-containing protein [Caldimicrobium sp.]